MFTCRARGSSPGLQQQIVTNSRRRRITEDYSRLAAEPAVSIRLGYGVEREDPNLDYEMPPDDEIRWLADWLVSEGWTRPEDWLHSGGGAGGAG
jgi:hypothetical protein